MSKRAEKDADARKPDEDALRRSEEYFRALIENAQDIVMVFGADNVIRYRSPSASGRGTLGYQTAELVGQSGADVIANLIHPQDREKNARRLS